MLEQYKSHINRIYWITLLSFILPFIILLSFSWVLEWLTMDNISAILLSPIGAIPTIVFLGIAPFILKKQVVKIITDIEKGENKIVQQKIYWGRYLFIFINFIYALMAYPILKSIGFSGERLTLSVISNILFNFTAPLPFLILIYHQLDIICKNVKIDRDYYFTGISSKIRLTNLVTTIFSIAFLSLGFYSLLWNKVDENNVLTISISEVGIKLIIVSTITALFIIVPMLFLGKRLTSQIEEMEKHTNLIADGDLRQILDRSSSDELGLMIESINEMRRNLHVMMKGIQKASSNINQVGNVVQNSSTNLAKESNNQVTYTVDMSNSIEQMTMNIEGNSASAEQCDVLNAEVEQLANKSYEIVMKNVEVINDITNKVKVINEIANQTNLLAINATIEAASAGEHGKSFAIVAKEVRTLAEKSKLSSKEINELSSLCLTLVEDTQKAIQTLRPKAETTSELSAQIAKVSKINRDEGLQISEKIHHLNTVAQSNSDISNELSHQSQKLNKQVRVLNKLIEEIKV